MTRIKTWFFCKPMVWQSVRDRYNEPVFVKLSRWSPDASQLPLGPLRQPHRTGPQFPRQIPSSRVGQRDREVSCRCSGTWKRSHGGGKDSGMVAEGLAAGQPVSRVAEHLRCHHGFGLRKCSCYQLFIVIIVVVTVVIVIIGAVRVGPMVPGPTPKLLKNFLLLSQLVLCHRVPGTYLTINK